MSWSIALKGKANEVALQAEEYFKHAEDNPCPEPEESIKQQARLLIASLCTAQKPEDRAISISAYGSQSGYTSARTDASEHISNSFRLECAVLG